MTVCLRQAWPSECELTILSWPKILGQVNFRKRLWLLRHRTNGLRRIMLGMGNYNYEHFSRELLEDLARTSFSGPESGDRAPDFKATSLQGDSVRLSDFQDKQNVLLLFGSATCPMTA